MGKSIRPRDIKIEPMSGNNTTTVKAWHYRLKGKSEVVVEVRDRKGQHLSTVVFDIRYPRGGKR